MWSGKAYLGYSLTECNPDLGDGPTNGPTTHIWVITQV